MPLYACAVACVLWERCPVTRSPPCGRLHRKTVKPLPPPTCLFGWTDPWRRHSFKRRQHHEDAMAAKTKKTKQTSALDFAIWDGMAVIFFSVQNAARRPAKTNRKTQKLKAFYCGRTIQWPIKVRSSRPSAVKFLASPHARDDVESRPPWRAPSRNCMGNHSKQQRSTTNKQ